MRGSCCLGVVLGVVTTAYVAMHLQTSTTLMRAATPVGAGWADQYAQRLEHAYESYQQLELQDPTAEETLPDEEAKAAAAAEEEEVRAAAAAEAAAAAAFEAAAAVADDGPTTPAPTSTIVVVMAPPNHIEPQPLPPLLPPALPWPPPPAPNALPPWVLRQVPCAGTGSQYCARGLEPAVPPPILHAADELESIPAAWLQEVEDRNLPASFEAAARNALDSSAARPSAACPPHLPGCRGSSPPDGPDGRPLALPEHAGSSRSSSGRNGRGACASKLGDSGSGDVEAMARQLQALFTPAAATTGLEVAFTVVTASELDLVDELAATAQRLGWVPAGGAGAEAAATGAGAASRGAVGGGAAGDAVAATCFFVVAVGPAALEAACRAGLAAVAVAASTDPAAARYAAAATLARPPPSSRRGDGGEPSPLAATQWAFLPDVWLLRHPRALLDRSHLAAAAEAATASAAAAAAAAAAADPRAVDLLVALRLLPDASAGKGTNNPSPDSGLWWARSTPSTAALFARLAGQANARAALRDGENGGRGPGRGAANDPLTAGGGWLRGRGWGGLAATAGGVDEADEASFGCAVRALPLGPWQGSDDDDDDDDDVDEAAARAAFTAAGRRVARRRTRAHPVSAGVAAALRALPQHCAAAARAGQAASATTAAAAAAGAAGAAGSQGVRWSVFDSRLVGVDDRHPRPGPGSVAYRVPGGGHGGGRAAVKELGLWEGSNCYYCVGDLGAPAAHARAWGAGRSAGTGAGAAAATTRRQFLVYDGIVASNALPVYHRFPMTAATLTQLVALAFATDRVLVLPAVLQMQKWMHAWEVVDAAVLDRFVSWRPATFFDHLASRTRQPAEGGSGGLQGGAGGWAWNASGVRAAQLAVRGAKGIGVRELGPGRADRPRPSRWFRVARARGPGAAGSSGGGGGGGGDQGGQGGAGVSQRQQEWAVARNAPETRDATILFVKFRRTTEALLSQPCATNPQRLCTNGGVASSAWLEFHVSRAMHWCHHITKFKVALPNANEAAKRAGTEKNEWEHFDRYKTGAFIKPVDECAWPKPYVWPQPPESLTSFHAGGGGKDLQTKAAAGKHGAPSQTAAAAALWAASAAHPCFGAAAAALAAREQPRGTNGAMGGAAALSAALWVKFEWAHEMAEAGLLAGRTESELTQGSSAGGVERLLPPGHPARDPARAPLDLRDAAHLQRALAHLVVRGLAAQKASPNDYGRCAVPAFEAWPFEL